MEKAGYMMLEAFTVLLAAYVTTTKLLVYP
jgi:hypothetical protein